VKPRYAAHAPVWYQRLVRNRRSFFLGPTHDLGDEPRDYEPESLSPLPFGANCAYRRELLLRLGYAAELGPNRETGTRGGEDTLLARRVLDLGYRLVYAPRAEVHHPVSAERMTPQFVVQAYYWQGVEKVRIRSVLTCASRRGVCARCYGADLSTGRVAEEGLAVGILAAQSIGYSTGPSGVYMLGLFDRLGVADRIKDKLKQTPSGVFVGDLIAKREVAIGFQQVSEIATFPGVDFVGPLPAEVQQTTVFSSAIISGAKQAEAAKQWVKFLTTPQAAAAFKKRGMEPG